MNQKTILLDHGSGGELTNELIENVFLKNFNDTQRIIQSDSAILPWGTEQMAFTSDGFVVKPLFFPGGDIGKLSVCGTVNDLAVSGAVPRYLSCSYIIEEGFLLSDLERIVQSQAKTAKEAGIKIVCGDTKVVEKGSGDGLFITSSGLGSLPQQFTHISTAQRIKSDDVILVSGPIGDHGATILCARENLQLTENLKSDCAPLGSLVQNLLKEVSEVHFMRDATRGGLATVLCELSELVGETFGLGTELVENDIPIRISVAALSEMLGLDPLYLANEGTIVVVVAKEQAQKALETMKKDRFGKEAAIIGRITEQHPGRAILETEIGGKRILHRLSGDQLPRIC